MFILYHFAPTVPSIPNTLPVFSSCLHLRIEPRAQPLWEGPETIKPTACCVLEPWSLTAVPHLEGHKGTQCNWRYPPEETQTVHGEDKPSPLFDCPVRLDPEASFQGLVKAQGTDVGSAPPKHPSMQLVLESLSGTKFILSRKNSGCGVQNKEPGGEWALRTVALAF